MQGVEEFLRGFEEYTREKIYPEEFGAKVFKIARDGQGNRLTYMKITGGSLKVKANLPPQAERKAGDRRFRGGRNRQSPGRRRWIRSACIPEEI